MKMTNIIGMTITGIGAYCILSTTDELIVAITCGVIGGLNYVLGKRAEQ